MSSLFIRDLFQTCRENGEPTNSVWLMTTEIYLLKQDCSCHKMLQKAEDVSLHSFLFLVFLKVFWLNTFNLCCVLITLKTLKSLLCRLRYPISLLIDPSFSFKFLKLRIFILFILPNFCYKHRKLHNQKSAKI